MMASVWLQKVLSAAEARESNARKTGLKCPTLDARRFLKFPLTGKNQLPNGCPKLAQTVKNRVSKDAGSDEGVSIAKLLANRGGIGNQLIFMCFCTVFRAWLASG